EMKTALCKSDMITNIELAAIKRDRKELERIKEDYDQLAASIREREEDVIDRNEAGILVDGEARVITRRRQNISWLTVVKRRLGKDVIVAVKNDWPMSLYEEVRIA